MDDTEEREQGTAASERAGSGGSTGPPEAPTSPGPADEGAAEDTGDAVGNDNIREGRVGGLMGGPRQSQGQGQGG
jgi:hypothetical protein